MLITTSSFRVLRRPFESVQFSAFIVMKAITLDYNPVGLMGDFHRASLDGTGYTQLYFGEML
jgi:hypothetical protein